MERTVVKHSIRHKSNAQRLYAAFVTHPPPLPCPWSTPCVPPVVFLFFGRASPHLVPQTSLVAFQGFFNALVYGSTDAVKASVVQELLVERCLKASGACRGGRGEPGQRDNNGLDPEDAEDSSMGMGTTGNR